jgi:acyl-CoA ligase (AMP-forming) (exosortase A-associated)
MLSLVHQLIEHQALKQPERDALHFKDSRFSYRQLWLTTLSIAKGLEQLGLTRGARIAIYLPKQPESVLAMFAASAANCVFVPINPLLKPPQVKHILQDCNVECLITSHARASQLEDVLDVCAELRHCVLVDQKPEDNNCTGWDSLLESPNAESVEAFEQGHRLTSAATDNDIAAILYTSGSTGKPKGVVLSHRNMVCGAESVASYLHNTYKDRLLAVLPFSFDYGLSQLTTAFFVGASVVLMEYLLPRDVIRAVERYQITGLAAVPPLWNQLAELDWPVSAKSSLRYITNSGGAVPPALSNKLYHALPETQIYLMYGLTEAFRSTYLPPTELRHRPSSIGKAIPNAQISIVRRDGSLCDDNEVGELVHSGPLVAQGYWNAPEKTAERFKPLPLDGKAEIAVWSGDQAYRDEDGYLYFIGREDEMIKTSGYRVSPTEIEEVLAASNLVSEAAVFGVAHASLGQAIVAAVTINSHSDEQAVLSYCRQQLPNFMWPQQLISLDSLPRTANGKIDRKLLHDQYTVTTNPEEAGA